MPSETAIRDWLACFHDFEQEKQKELHKAFIHQPNEPLMGLIRCNASFAAEEALAFVPAGVNTVFLRSDAAGYQEDLLKYCAEAKNKRFGTIQFAVGAPVNEAFRQAVAEVAEGDWRPLYRRDR